MRESFTYCVLFNISINDLASCGVLCDGARREDKAVGDDALAEEATHGSGGIFCENWNARCHLFDTLWTQIYSYKSVKCEIQISISLQRVLYRSVLDF